MLVKIPKSEALQGGSYNSKIHDWRIQGATTYNDDDCISIEGLDDNIFALNEVYSVVGIGGYVEDYAAFIKMPSNKIDDIIPEGLSNRDIFDKDGNVVGSHTWMSWRDNTHPVNVVDGYVYFGSNPFGKDISGKELNIINDVDGVEVISAQQYKDEMTVSEEFSL